MDDIEDGWGDDEIGDLQEDGWGDDELDIGNDDDDGSNAVAAVKEKDSLSVNDGGWDWEDDDVSNFAMNEGQAGTSQQKKDAFFINSRDDEKSPGNPLLERATQGLVEYVRELSGGRLLQSLNEQLNIQCNHSGAALQLCHYYHDRPNLKEYTLDAEITRMAYQIIISDEIVLTDVNEIQQYFGVDHPVDNLVDDMLLRSSNQSLLADVFPVITGSDKIVRMEYLANAVATKCRFVLDMRQGRRRNVQVDCTLVVSIPSGMPAPSSKLDMATLRLMIDFSPEPSAPYVKYQIVSIQSLINLSNEMEKIRTAAETVDAHQLEMAAMEEATPTNNEMLRDNFIESLASTQSGFKSAMRDLDSTLNMSHKLKYVRNISAAAATMLPSADEIMRAANNAEDDSVRPSPMVEASTVSNPESRRQFLPPPPPPPPPPPRPMSQEAPPDGGNHMSRPKPIIGGLLISGISRLAKAAKLPQEEEVTPLYRKDEPTQHTSTSIPNQTSQSVSGTRASPPLPPPPPLPPIPIKGSMDDANEKVPPASTSLDLESDLSLGDGKSGDGWSDDDDLEIVDDNDNDNPCVTNSSATLKAQDTLVASTTDDARPKLKDLGKGNSMATKNSNIEIIQEKTNSMNTNKLHEVRSSLNSTDEQKQDGPSTVRVEEGKGHLELERKHLLQKVKEIEETKSVLRLYTVVPDDSDTITPRKQFVSRSEILDIKSVRGQFFIKS